MSSSITNLLYAVRNVGGTIKSSKKQYIWEFSIDGNPQKIELFDSKWSGKKRVMKNGIIECNLICERSFSRHFNLLGHSFTIIQYNDKMELRIDNQSFEHLYNLQRNKQFFTANPEPTSSVYYSNPIVQKEKSKVESINTGFYNNSKSQSNDKKLFDFKIKQPGDFQNQNFKKFQFGNENMGVSHKVNVDSDNNNNNFNAHYDQRQKNNEQNQERLLDFDIPETSNKENSTTDDLMNVFGGGTNNNNNFYYENNEMRNNQNFGVVNNNNPQDIANNNLNILSNFQFSSNEQNTPFTGNNVQMNNNNNNDFDSLFD